MSKPKVHIWRSYMIFWVLILIRKMFVMTSKSGEVIDFVIYVVTKLKVNSTQILLTFN